MDKTVCVELLRVDIWFYLTMKCKSSQIKELVLIFETVSKDLMFGFKKNCRSSFVQTIEMVDSLLKCMISCTCSCPNYKLLDELKPDFVKLEFR